MRDLERAIEAQRDWMAAQGGDLAGYRQHYAGFYNWVTSDAIYYADLMALSRLLALDARAQ
jgi:hypothetical protein